MNPTQDWIEAYKELCTLVKKEVLEVTHVDLWHEQIDYAEEDYPWPTHSVFLDFEVDNIETLGNNAQDLNMSVTVYHAFDTLSDSYDGSENQNTALEFGNVIRKIHHCLQSTGGNHFSSLNRTSLKRHPAKQYLIVYKQVYNCQIIDYAGEKTFYPSSVTAMEISPVAFPTINPEVDFYNIDMT